MKKYLILFSIFFILGGCNEQENDGLSWFKTENEAIQYGLNEENIVKDDMIAKLKTNGELYIIFKKKGNTVGLSNIARRNNEYTWYRKDAFVELKGDIKIVLTTKALSEKKFNLYIGNAKKKDITIATNLGIISPNIDQKTKLYYYMTPIN